MPDWLPSIIGLAAIGMLEAAVYLYRLRTGHADAPRLHNALATALVCATRVLFVAVGAGAVMRDAPMWAVVLAYVPPATLASDLCHRFSSSRTASRRTTPCQHASCTTRTTSCSSRSTRCTS